ncbi:MULTISPECIES: DUF4350 domain-containing protein [unclassified Streptomyces]|uniref:DUF4350 domain-containing protein n=1 Tax=unclassified Streptomyces TaxID=2593676 RepID=UPI002E153E1E
MSQPPRSTTGPDTTLLVTAPNLLTPYQQDELRAATTDATGRTVLLAADPLSVDALVPGVHVSSPGPHRTRKALTIPWQGHTSSTKVDSACACHQTG